MCISLIRFHELYKTYYIAFWLEMCWVNNRLSALVWVIWYSSALDQRFCDFAQVASFILVPFRFVKHKATADLGSVIAFMCLVAFRRYSLVIFVATYILKYLVLIYVHILNVVISYFVLYLVVFGLFSSFTVFTIMQRFDGLCNITRKTIHRTRVCVFPSRPAPGVLLTNFTLILKKDCCSSKSEMIWSRLFQSWKTHDR